MHPVLFQLGSLTIHTYGVMLALGVASGVWVLNHLAKKSGLDPDKILSMALWVLLGGLAGARLAFVILEPGPAWERLGEVLVFWRGGLVFYGGLALAVPLGLWLARRNGFKLWPLLDVFAPALALGQAFGRLGCFFSGDSYGLPFNGPWAVVFTSPHSIAPRGIPLHPTQLYISGSLFLIFAFLLWLFPRRRFAGQVFLAYGISHGVARLIIEQFRGDWRGEALGGLITPTGLFALALVAACLAGYALLQRHRPRTA
jgi:phosphatidylglycerol---prolipoprotein diacylglyceryl transferase